MNAVWGTRLSKGNKEADKSECLPSKIHYPALAIWGKLILDLHDKCPFKQLVLAGSWARFVTPYEKGRRVSGPKYFQEWSKRISKSRIDKDQKRESGAIAEKLKALEGLTIYLADHPSTWKYGYIGQSGRPFDRDWEQTTIDLALQ